MSVTKFVFFAHKCKLLQYLWQRNLARFILLLCNYIIGKFGIFLARCYWHINGLPTRFVVSISRFCHNERVKRQAKRDLSTIIQLKFSTSFRRKDNRENCVTVFRISPGPPRFGTIHPSFSLGSDARTIGVGYVDPVITLRGCHVGDGQGRKWRLPQHDACTAEKLLKNISKLHTEFSPRNLFDIIY